MTSKKILQELSGHAKQAKCYNSNFLEEKSRIIGFFSLYFSECHPCQVLNILEGQAGDGKIEFSQFKVKVIFTVGSILYIQTFKVVKIHSAIKGSY